MCAYYENDPPYNARAWILWSLVYFPFYLTVPEYLKGCPEDYILEFLVSTDELTRQDQFVYFQNIVCNKEECTKLWLDDRFKNSLGTKSSMPICPHKLTRFATFNAIIKCELWDAFTLSRISNNIVTLHINHLGFLNIPSVMGAYERHKAYLFMKSKESGGAMSSPFLQGVQLDPRPRRSTYHQHAEVYSLLSLHVGKGGMALHRLARIYANICSEFHKQEFSEKLMAQWFPPQTRSEHPEPIFDREFVHRFRAGILFWPNFGG